MNSIECDFRDLAVRASLFAMVDGREENVKVKVR